jgi:hypothetical protein
MAIERDDLLPVQVTEILNLGAETADAGIHVGKGTAVVIMVARHNKDGPGPAGRRKQAKVIGQTAGIGNVACDKETVGGSC